jgi:PBP1b-binding outer membrane lipoprotein LpoB
MFLKQQQDPSREAVMTLKSRTTYLAVACTAAAALLAGCAGQPTTVAMDNPAQTVQTMTVPKGTFLGGASAGEATALAQGGRHQQQQRHGRVRRGTTAEVGLQAGTAETDTSCPGIAALDAKASLTIQPKEFV